MEEDKAKEKGRREGRKEVNWIKHDFIAYVLAENKTSSMLEYLWKNTKHACVYF